MLQPAKRDGSDFFEKAFTFDAAGDVAIAEQLAGVDPEGNFKALVIGYTDDGVAAPAGIAQRMVDVAHVAHMPAAASAEHDVIEVPASIAGGQGAFIVFKAGAAQLPWETLECPATVTTTGAHITLVQPGACASYMSLTDEQKEAIADDIRIAANTKLSGTHTWMAAGVIQTCGTVVPPLDKRGRRDIALDAAAVTPVGDLITVLIGQGTLAADADASDAAAAIQAGIADGSITIDNGVYSLTSTNTNPPTVVNGPVTAPAAVIQAKLDCPAECAGKSGKKSKKSGKKSKKGCKAKGKKAKGGGTGCDVDCSACPAKGKKAKATKKAKEDTVSKKGKKGEKGSLLSSSSIVSPAASVTAAAVFLAVAVGVLAMGRRRRRADKYADVDALIEQAPANTLGESQPLFNKVRTGRRP
jgi:hypothetical protein